MSRLKVLVACEHSGRVRSAFRALGHDAWSCDLEPADDGGEHIQGDALEAIKQPWDMVIAFPPCTYLCVSGLHWNTRRPERERESQAAAQFFLAFTKLRCPWAIENPVGMMSTVYREPDQIIQPWQFGDEARKTTCLWLHDLPGLNPTKIVGHGELRINPDGRTYPAWMTSPGRHRQITFQGVADAMARQWSVPHAIQGTWL